MSSFRVLGIDPGFERVGMAVVERVGDKGKKETLLYSACFKTDPKTPFHERLTAIGHEMKRVMELYQPTALAVEKLFLTTNQKTAMQVAEARGVMLYESALRGLEIHEYAPLAIKMAMTGYGKADKTQVAFMVKKLLPASVGVKSDDEMDAIAVALTALASVKHSPLGAR